MEKINDQIREIIKDVRNGGDRAIRIYTKKFDKIGLTDFSVSKKEKEVAYTKVSKKTIRAIKYSIRNVKKFTKLQYKQYKSFEIEMAPGLILGQKIVPISRVGLYIPAGKYPLFSSIIMMAVPANVAGVEEIIICTPPPIKPEIIVTSDMLGIKKIFKIGGPQAIAAMAFGTETIPKVDKIFGPGNKYVTEAKKQLFGTVGIDKIAGPSEILVLADDQSNPKFIAADLLAQAEHDENARAILVSLSKKLAEAVQREIRIQLQELKTKEIAAKSWKNNGKIFVCKDEKSAIEIINSIAPEHLEIQTKNPKKYMEKVKNFGSLFLGPYSAEVFGDYVSGTNHVLPTSGAAKFSDGLSIRDFFKIQTYQLINKKINKELYIAAKEMAEKEGLYAHKNAIEKRE